MPSHILEGNFEGTVIGFRWTKWTDEEQGKNVPILTLECEVGEHKLFPSLFFDNELATQGNDAGKSRTQISLETLKSYGVENIDPSDASNNNPHEFGPAMEGKVVHLFCKDDEGKQKVYINRGRKPELKEEEVTALWAELSGGESAEPVKPKNVKKGKAASDDEDLVF